MSNLLIAAAKRVLSPGERAALRTFLAERKIAQHHRAGLRQIRRQSLERPAKLNLGCGPHKKEGFLNVDLLPPADLTLDLRLGLPFESNCCDLIFSEHCLEHIDYPEPVSHLFRECLRVLKPNGRLLFSVPGTEWPLNDYGKGPDAPYFRACGEHAWHPPECTTRMEHINYHFRQDAEHRFAYDFETAEKVLAGAGFIAIQERPFDAALDSEHRRIGSLFISARKAG
jgi:predicted SAM-dependent methyltransferase